MISCDRKRFCLQKSENCLDLYTNNKNGNVSSMVSLELSGFVNGGLNFPKNKIKKKKKKKKKTDYFDETIQLCFRFFVINFLKCYTIHSQTIYAFCDE